MHIRFLQCRNIERWMASSRSLLFVALISRGLRAQNDVNSHHFIQFCLLRRQERPVHHLKHSPRYGICNMIVANVCKAAAAAVVGSLAMNMGRNMVETHRLVGSNNHHAPTMLPTSVAELQKLSRKEVVNLFLHHCEAPADLGDLEGEWNGALLPNNGLVRH